MSTLREEYSRESKQRAADKVAEEEVSTAHSIRIKRLEESLNELKEENTKMTDKIAAIAATGENSKGKRLRPCTSAHSPPQHLSESFLTGTVLAGLKAGGTTRGNKSMTSDSRPYIHRSKAATPLPENTVYGAHKGMFHASTHHRRRGHVRSTDTFGLLHHPSQNFSTPVVTWK